MGGAMPLAAPAMYKALGPEWAGTLLGLLEVICIPIPFVFYRYGHRIRERSTLIREMRENKERMDKKKLRAAEKMRKRVEAETYQGPALSGAVPIAESRDIEKDALA